MAHTKGAWLGWKTVASYMLGQTSRVIYYARHQGLFAIMLS